MGHGDQRAVPYELPDGAEALLRLFLYTNRDVIVPRARMIHEARVRVVEETGGRGGRARQDRAHLIDTAESACAVALADVVLVTVSMRGLWVVE